MHLYECKAVQILSFGTKIFGPNHTGKARGDAPRILLGLLFQMNVVLMTNEIVIVKLSASQSELAAPLSFLSTILLELLL
jgi:hypothetical protein